jgi:Fe-S cluster assembly scaffold protein SufB
MKSDAEKQSKGKKVRKRRKVEPKWFTLFRKSAYHAFRELGMAGEFAEQAIDDLNITRFVDESNTKSARNCLDRLDRRIVLLRRCLAIADGSTYRARAKSHPGGLRAARGGA